MENWHYEIHQMYNDTYKVINPWEDKIFMNFNWNSVGEKNDKNFLAYEKFLVFLNETQISTKYKLATITLNYNE